MDLSKFLPLIGVLIFVAVLINTDIPAILGILAGANPFYLLFALAFHIPVFLIKAGKWKVITNAYGKGASMSRCAHAWIVGFIIGIVTPGRIGEFTKAYYLKDDMPVGCGIATVAIDRIIDIAVLFVLAISGAFLFLVYYSGFLQSDFIYLLTIMFVVFLGVVFFVLTRGNFVRRLARPMFERLVPKKYKSRMRSAFDDFYKGLGKIRSRWHLVLITILMSFLSWLVIIFQFTMIAASLSIQLEYLFLLSIIPVVILLDTLPISFSGLGTRELALIFFLGIIGIPLELIISFSVLIFIVGYLVYVPFGLILWFMRPIKIEI